MRLTSISKQVLEYLIGGDIRSAWSTGGGSDAGEFAEAVTIITGESAEVCEHCSKPTWTDDTTRIDDELVCDDCRDTYFSFCDSCSEYTSETWHVDGSDFCDSCRDCECTYCEQCEEWHQDDSEHSHDCGCEAPIKSFRFPANGDGTVSQDERLHVTMPGGVIDDVGIGAITRLVWDSLRDTDGFENLPWILYGICDDIGSEWQTKQGNFTKRLSKKLATYKVKMSKETISEVGNLAKAHSASTSEWDIEFTRDLNQSAEAFFHEDSCWWGSYSSSRCALKNWGGIGMRSFNEFDTVLGRAWVQPLDEDLKPTHRTEDVHAYLVYNGYGNLEGYAPARMIAHLTGKSYRKVDVRLDSQYVNNDSGYLVADQEVCDETEQITVRWDCHHDGDREQARELVAV